MDTCQTRTVGTYTVSDDPSRLDFKAMHAYLRRSYWAQDIPLEIVERAARGLTVHRGVRRERCAGGTGAVCFDFATFAYVCDVYVLEEHRGHGLSKAMMAMASEHPSCRACGAGRWSRSMRMGFD